MLAICSKNNEQDVLDVFDRHDGMVLKREDFVAHRINWREKATNIESIAQELNIGLDSLVFIDDSPLEIDLVLNALPMVACIKVPGDVARLPSSFNSFKLFDRELVSEEDRIGSEMMLQEKDRKALATSVSSEEFAKALKLTVDFFKAKAEEIARVTQLINKTNQFNLTTQRRTAAEVLETMRCPRGKGICLAGRGSFRGLWLGRRGNTDAYGRRFHRDRHLPDELPSARAWRRKWAVFAAMAAYARLQGATKLRGRYIPTQKNSARCRSLSRSWVHSDGRFLLGNGRPEQISVACPHHSSGQ